MLQKKLLVLFPLIFISILALGFSFYYIYFLYSKTFEYAKEFLISQSNFVSKSYSKWFQERRADITFILRTKELKSFLFSKNLEVKKENELFLKDIVGRISKSHNYKNFWIFNQNGEKIFDLNPEFEHPKMLLNGQNFYTLIQNPESNKKDEFFMEFSVQNKNKGILFIVINKLFEGIDTNKFFCFVSAFVIDEIFYDFIPSFWSKYEIVEYTFGYKQPNRVLAIWNFPKKLDSLVSFPFENEIVPFQVKTSNAGFFDGKSFIEGEETLGYLSKFSGTNIFFTVKLFKTRVLTQFYILTIILGVAGIFFGFATFLGIKSIKEDHRKKRLLIEKEYLNRLYSATKKYELFTHFANDIIITCDESNNIIEVNNKATELLRYSEIELKSKTFYELVHPDDLEKFFSYEPNKGHNLEIRLLDSQGNEIYCTISKNRIESEGQSFIFYIITDVTELVNQIERSFRLNRLLTASRMINEIILKRFELGDIFARACEISVMVGGFNSSIFLKYIKPFDEFIVFSKFGSDLSDIIGEEINFSQLVEKFPFFKQAIEKKTIVLINNLEGCENITPEINQLSKFGMVSCVVLPIVQSGELFGLFLLCSKRQRMIDDEEFLVLEEMRNDISFAIDDYFRDIKLTEAEFKRNLFFDRSPNGFVLVDGTGRIESTNNYFKKLLGISSGDVIGEPICEIFQCHKDELEKMLRTLVNGGFEKMELSIKTLEGERWLLVVGEFIEEYNFYLLVFSDITDQKNYQFELEKQKERAEELEKLKSHLLQNVSHEFRTPLNGILGFSNVLKSFSDTPEVKEFADMIYESGYRLYKTLESLIFTSQIVSGVVKPRKEIIDLKSLLEDLVNEVKFLTKEKKVQLNLNIKCKDCLTFTDKELLSIIIYSLLDNAFKFTHSGEVQVSVDEILELGQKRYLIEVKDTGIGIKPEVKEKIFELFRQGSEGLAREYEGLGVGLFNAKRLVDLLGGSLTFESEVNKGTTFYVKI
ncbi:MAG: PAS domain S-box protein [Ignavibacteria bacterium]|nr:PAS domain S-box protein [Ignavibacteria bacterium]